MKIHLYLLYLQYFPNIFYTILMTKILCKLLYWNVHQNYAIAFRFLCPKLLYLYHGYKLINNFVIN